MRRRPLSWIALSLAVLTALLVGGYTVFQEPLREPTAYARGHSSGLENDVVYFIMVDRFSNGNRANDVPLWAFPVSSRMKATQPGLYRERLLKQKLMSAMYNPDPEDKNRFAHYFGGDLEGIIQRLSYLQKLGITAVIISPVFENVDGFRGNMTAYHGYWTKDWFRLDEHFANPPARGGSAALTEALRGRALMRRLVSSAHSKGIKVLLDITMNHTSPSGLDEFAIEPGKPIPESGYLMEFAPIYKDGQFLHQFCQPTSTRTCRDTIVRNDWYHLDGRGEPRSIEGRDWRNEKKVETRMLEDLPDFDQKNPEVSRYLLEMAHTWLDTGVDGFRIDAVKHISPDFLREFEQSLLSRKPDVILVGEYFDGGNRLEPSVQWLKSGERYTMFDFAFANSARELFSGKQDWVGAKFEVQNLLSHTPEGRARQDRLGDLGDTLVTFLNNHDLARMLSVRHARPAQYEAALKFLMLARGTPALLYGDEIGLALPYNAGLVSVMGKAADLWSRPMMKWLSDAELERNSTFQLTRKLIALRKSNPAIRGGYTRFFDALGLQSRIRNFITGYDYLAMERSAPDERAQVYFFYSASAQSLRFPVSVPDGHYPDALDPRRTYLVHGGVIYLNNMKPDQVAVIAVSK